ncbi:hypothetical protein H6P81_009019 [Aristolochia fimbriata]|uniref:Tetratricopeptide repeat protein 5 OB fold domain-containing protein n=1 Tax=Aristolochia fimbriata TaxID=158543 RepID=A0AAV7EK18_ARIFI|nr:hypothetical protein H6P81_009019 [Aristolochia fimbriata]
MSGPSEVENQDIFSEIAAAAESLDHIRDTYFPANPDDKTSRLQKEADLALKLLDSIPLEQRRSSSRRATFEFLRGKMLNVFSDYRKEAEDHLSKAVKLNPSLADAWLSLGDCLWKKGDLTAAKNVLCLALEKCPNKKIYCQLSMLERKMAQDSYDQVQLVDESVEHAKEAVSCDVKDGYSWYNLGNAWLTRYFVTGAWDQKILLEVLKAYVHAEKDESMKSNPDLYYNCATVNKFLQNYERALSGFEAATLKDPGLNASEQVQHIVNLLDRIESSMNSHTNTKRLAAAGSSLVEFKLNTLQRATVSCLHEGSNRAGVVVGKVLLFIQHDDAPPLCYLVCDADQICFILSVYGLKSDAIKVGDQVTLVGPHYQSVDFSWKAKRYSFKSVRVDLMEQILVNGKALPPHLSVQPYFLSQHRP